MPKIAHDSVDLLILGHKDSSFACNTEGEREAQIIAIASIKVSRGLVSDQIIVRNN
jgi:hypothetical protein